MIALLYPIGVLLYALGVRFVAFTKPKARAFVDGRKRLLERLEAAFAQEHRPVIWMHCASLGEFEQGRPLLEKIKKEHAGHAILLTFFSPSGYEIRKNDPVADYVFYLPLDTPWNARRFLNSTRPKLALFVKYELWHYYLRELQLQKIPTVLVSAHFQANQVFFQWYGVFFRRMLECFEMIFVQDQSSKQLLQTIGITRVKVAGDTRFDRSMAVFNQAKEYDAVRVFKGKQRLIVAGSIWEQDLDFLLSAFRRADNRYRLLLVPHEVGPESIQRIRERSKDPVPLWTDDQKTLEAHSIAIVHEVGHLAHLYKYADAAWIGGGFRSSGIHNLIEAAVFGLPLFFGPNYHRFREAEDLVAYGGAQSFRFDEPERLVQILRSDDRLRAMGTRAQEYVSSQLGATERIYEFLVSKCLATSV